MQASKLKKLQSEIEQYRSKKLAKQRKEQQEEKEAQERQAKFWREEDKLLPKKMRLIKEIFAWKEEFVKTKQFKQLFDNSGDEIIVFHSGWGHDNPRYCGLGCWSRLYLEKSGNLKYWAGYKWMPPASGTILNNDEKTARKFTYKYLRELNEAIKLGQIYKTIIKKLKEEF